MTSPARPEETLHQRDDRNLTDLLQELREAGIAVQVLFGFLLGLPFTTRFDRLEAWRRWLYLAILVLAAVSIVLLVAPVLLPLTRRQEVPDPPGAPPGSASPKPGRGPVQGP
jgi:hypothetical protein